MNKNQKRNERPRDEKGRFVSFSAAYSIKHNVVNLEKIYEKKIKEWSEQGLCKADNIIRSFDYRQEAYRIPNNYKCTPEKAKELLSGNYNYILEMSNLIDANIEEPETILSVARMITLKNGNPKTLYFKNGLSKNEGLILLPLEYLDKDLNFYTPYTVEPKDTELLFQGVVAKRKLKDLVIDTYYKLDFNKTIRTHYVHKNKLRDDAPTDICRYWSTPIKYWNGPTDHR